MPSLPKSERLLAFFSCPPEALLGPSVEIFASHNNGFYIPAFSGTIDGRNVSGRVFKSLSGPGIVFSGPDGEVSTAYASIPLRHTEPPVLLMTYADKEYHVNIAADLSLDIVSRFGRHGRLDAETIAKTKVEMRPQSRPQNSFVLSRHADNSASFRMVIGGSPLDGSLTPGGVVTAVAQQTQTGQLESNANETELHHVMDTMLIKTLLRARW